jgi:hypothetical protein
VAQRDREQGRERSAGGAGDRSKSGRRSVLSEESSPVRWRVTSRSCRTRQLCTAGRSRDGRMLLGLVAAAESSEYAACTRPSHVPRPRAGAWPSLRGGCPSSARCCPLRARELASLRTIWRSTTVLCFFIHPRLEASSTVRRTSGGRLLKACVGVNRDSREGETAYASPLNLALIGQGACGC